MPGFFSFNSGEGRCERCMGNGFEKIEDQEIALGEAVARTRIKVVPRDDMVKIARS